MNEGILRIEALKVCESLLNASQMESYLNTIWTLFEMDKSCIPVAKLSGRTRVLQVADTQWPENFSHCTLHTVSLFPLSRCQIPFRNNNAFQQQLGSHTAKPCGCWSIKSSRVFVRSLIKVSSVQSGLVNRWTREDSPSSQRAGKTATPVTTRMPRNNPPLGSDTLQNHFVCLKNRPATGRSWCFVEMSKPSVRWSQILTHWSLSQKATVSQQQRFPTTASQPHCQPVRLLEQGFKFSIWLGRSLDPKHSPWCKFTTDRKNCDFSDDLDASKQPKSDLKIPKRTISTRVASNTLETTSMWNTSTKNGSFWESFERINLNIKNRYVSGQKPFNRRFQYQPLQHRGGRWCIFIYKEHSFLPLFFVLVLAKTIRCTIYRTFVKNVLDTVWSWWKESVPNAHFSEVRAFAQKCVRLHKSALVVHSAFRGTIGDATGLFPFWWSFFKNRTFSWILLDQNIYARLKDGKSRKECSMEVPGISKFHLQPSWVHSDGPKIWKSK